mmetsp:Transcript_19642/g.49947  ORF Transcript_19642/g.49947 Transcript_19642/m.49947 type:complete len:254 (+) Transcript_19642:823-1584(+)
MSALDGRTNAARLSRNFEEELHTLRSCDHPCVLQLLAYSLEKGQLCLVSPLMAYSLHDALHVRACAHVRAHLSPRARIEVARQVCDGLLYLHTPDLARGKGVVLHRAVKSANVLLAHDFFARICDAGLGAMGGTPGYGAPELQSGQQCSERSDVFAFGVVLLELFAGQPPLDMQKRPPLLVARCCAPTAPGLDEAAIAAVDLRLADDSAWAQPAQHSVALELLGLARWCADANAAERAPLDSAAFVLGAISAQ